ncbi:MAG: hypothetical protein CL942_02285 [Desulfovibrio sp.]|nr:hypothetical protein [Desulfovibrio sp.]
MISPPAGKDYRPCIPLALRGEFTEAHRQEKPANDLFYPHPLRQQRHRIPKGLALWPPEAKPSNKSPQSGIQILTLVMEKSEEGTAFGGLVG